MYHLLTSRVGLEWEGLQREVRLNLLDIFVYLANWKRATAAGFQSHPDQYGVRTVRLPVGFGY